jgi:hypothetical protein
LQTSQPRVTDPTDLADLRATRLIDYTRLADLTATRYKIRQKALVVLRQ